MIYNLHTLIYNLHILIYNLHTLIHNLDTLFCFTQKLTHLNLHGCSRLSGKCLDEVLPELSSLKSLNLSHCPSCSDRLLIEFGKRSVNIQELLVESCNGVTDAGIKAIISSNKQSSDQIGCLDIRHLNVSSSSVSTKSLWLILLGLPKLRKLSFSNIQSGLDENCLTLSDNLLELENLNISYTYISSSNIKWLYERCPRLAEVTMNCSFELQGSILQHLTCLTRLTSLNLEGACSELHFEHVAKFLVQRGNQLTSLNASGIAGVQISVLCLYCQALKDLVLADCQNLDASIPTWSALTEKQRKHIGKSEEFGDLYFSDFCKLQHLNLNHTTFSIHSTEIEQQLLFKLLASHETLQKLLLKGVIGVDDEVLQNFLESSSNAKLCTLNLSGCENITIASVYKVLESCNNLRLLDLSHCWHVGQSDVSTINVQMKKSGNPLEIIWV